MWTVILLSTLTYFLSNCLHSNFKGYFVYIIFTFKCINRETNKNKPWCCYSQALLQELLLITLAGININSIINIIIQLSLLCIVCKISILVF